MKAGGTIAGVFHSLYARAAALRLQPSASPSVSADQRLRLLHNELIDRIWNGLFIIAMVGIPVSLLRSLNTGWVPLYTAHSIIGLMVLVVHFLRRWMSADIRVAVIMLMFWAIGIFGMVSLGLMGTGLWWLAVSSLLMSTLYSARAGLFTMLAVFTVVFVIGLGFIHGQLSPQVDANMYVKTPAAWISAVIATAIMPVVVFQAVVRLQRMTTELLNEVDAQRKTIEIMATHDQLTGLPAMNLALDRLEQAQRSLARSNTKVALLFIDLDGFKSVNDTYGHEAGDAILKAVAQKWRPLIREHDTLARMGGDEFLAILQGVADINPAIQVASKIIDSIAEPLSYSGHRIHIGASIGVAISPDHAQDSASLIRVADMAMYEAKRKGKNRFSVAGTQSINSSSVY